MLAALVTLGLCLVGEAAGSYGQSTISHGDFTGIHREAAIFSAGEVDETGLAQLVVIRNLVRDTAENYDVGFSLVIETTKRIPLPDTNHSRGYPSPGRSMRLAAGHRFRFSAQKSANGASTSWLSS